jgi:thiol:disulfide interchange protein
MNTGSPGKRFREAVATEAPLQVIGIITAYVARMGEAIETLSWQTFSREALDQALATGRPVFVDFTADWCLICKSNERFALDTAPVREAVSKKNVIMLRADWTRGDPVITEILKRRRTNVLVLFGRQKSTAGRAARIDFLQDHPGRLE